MLRAFDVDSIRKPAMWLYDSLTQILLLRSKVQSEDGYKNFYKLCSLQQRSIG